MLNVALVTLPLLSVASAMLITEPAGIRFEETEPTLPVTAVPGNTGSQGLVLTGFGVYPGGQRISGGFPPGPAS